MMRKAILLGLVLATWLAANVRAQDQSGPINPPDTAPPVVPTPGSPLPDYAPRTRIRVGGNILATKITHKVDPVYPPLAKIAHVTGMVVLHAIIARDGSVEQLEAVSGPELLKQAAMDAVKEWRYQPTRLNGQPVEVDTMIQVVFTLGESDQATAPPTDAGSQAGEAQPQADAQAIDPQLKADILHLFDVMHLQARAVDMGHAMFQTIRPTLLAALPPTPNREKIAEAYGDRLFGLFSSQEFLDRSAALYAKYLSDSDVKALADFYQTPAGQHFNDVSGKLASGGAQIGQQLAMEGLPKILDSLCHDFPELKGTANFCPREKPEKKSLLIAPDGAGLEAPEAGN